MGRLASLLAENAARRMTDAADPTLGTRLAALRRWQAARLAASYADLAATPRYARAVTFFLGELYGGGELTLRDRDLARATRALERMLPARARRALAAAIALDLATQDLDARLSRRLPLDEPLTAASYARAFRESASRIERDAQLEATLTLGRELDRLVATPGLRLLLGLTRAPAEARGLGALQGFLERGYAAFRATGGAAEFLATIRARESQLLDALYRGDASRLDSGDA